MARLNRKGELWSNISQLQIVRDATGTFGNTTLTAAVAVGAGTLTVAAITNFAVGEWIKIGNGERTELVRVHPSTPPAVNTITLDPLTVPKFAHSIGEVVTEQALVDLGHIDDTGVVVTHGGAIEDVNSAVQRMLFAQLTGYVNVRLAFNLLGYSVENLAVLFGATEARILGAGTTAQPRVLTVRGDQVHEQTDIGFLATGARKDGSVVRITAMACEPEVNASFRLARGTKTVIPCSYKATAGVLYERWL